MSQRAAVIMFMSSMTSWGRHHGKTAHGKRVSNVHTLMSNLLPNNVDQSFGCKTQTDGAFKLKCDWISIINK